MNPVIVISERDNVATALEALEPGAVSSPARLPFTVREAIPRGHKVAMRAIPAGGARHQVRQPDRRGDRRTSRPARTCTRTTCRARAAAATWPHSGTRGRRPRSPSRPTTRGTHERRARRFHGYRRPDGRVGVRNHLLVVPTVICASVVAERVAAAVAPIGTALPHTAGCGQLGPDMHTTHDTLAAYCGHPNVGAVLVIALGCEQVVAQHLADAARRGRQAGADRRDPERRRARCATTARAIEIARALVAELERDAARGVRHRRR